MKRRALHLQIDRIAVTLFASACFAAAFALLPSSVRSQVAPANPDLETPAARAASPLSPIAAVADPFVPRITSEDAPPRPFPSARASDHEALRAQPPIRVTAIATGAQPSAIVEIGTSVEAVNAGDVLDGAVVTSISADGLELSDGRRVRLVPGRAAR